MMIRAGRHIITVSERTLIMGIINVTPDSFSDGGETYTFAQAKKRAEAMIAEGADLLDIGGESSRPGSQTITAGEEIRRIIPLVEYLSRNYPDIPLSIDTWKHEVAAAALEAGASIINDIYGLNADPQLAAVIKKHNAAVIVMHNAVVYREGHSAAQVFAPAWSMPAVRAAEYRGMDLLEAVRTQLETSIAIADAAGIGRDQIIIDPGIGFGLTSNESWSLLRSSGQLRELGLPILIAHSRKRFIGDIIDATPDMRDIGTAAATAAGIAYGADIIRVHNVAVNREAAIIADQVWRDTSQTTDYTRKLPAELSSRNVNEVPDRIYMKGMVFHGYTGCLPEEKTLGQKFIIDVIIELSDNKASYTDHLEDSISYADVFEVIRVIMADRHFNLIEKLAGYIADEILESFLLANQVEVCVSKPQAPVKGAFDTMQVCVRRSRNSRLDKGI